ncbi:MAG: hypothetical protein V7L21_19980 [Nostoc sp.]|uniref:hypothetical protein n=1 Tax=Nostoc sp. TaxID=1180 RepID=UPI002FF5D98F
MIIKKKRILNLEAYLNAITLGSKIVFNVSELQRFEEVLPRVGFTMALEPGELVLPARVFGARSRFNASGSHLVHRNLPKEEVCHLVEWHWKQWAGGGQLEDKSDWRDRCRKRYPRTPIPAPSIELKIANNSQGKKIVISPAIEYIPENRSLLLHIINLFLEIFGECEILQENLEAIVKVPLKRLNWTILPTGRYPWNQLQHVIHGIIERAPRGNQALIKNRLATINQHEPSFVAIGQAGFSGYFVFGFPTKKLYVLESLACNNATYILDKDWENLSRLTKAEILDASLHKERVIHRRGWHTKVQKLLAP